MNRTPRYLHRRQFIQATVPLVGLGLMGFGAIPILAGTREGEHSWEKVINDLLVLVNAERALEQASRLELDALGSQVASAHALEMAMGNFVSHWGRDGRKPYHRYSFAGGIHATEENIGSVDNLQSATWKDVEAQVIAAHLRMYAETPPNDGHRQTILAPQHTHVGFGIALHQRSLRLVEMFVAKYVEVDEVPRRVKRRSVVDLSGRLLSTRYEVHQVDVFYEPSPKPLDSTFLSQAQSYGLPDEYRALRPKLGTWSRYADGTFGDIELNGREFRAPIRLFKSNPGIYTVVVWVKMKYSLKPFPATEICIESE